MEKLTRRIFIKVAGVAIAGCSIGRTFYLDLSVNAQSSVPVRKAIHTLVDQNENFEPELQTYNDAVKLLKDQHPVLWSKMANIHDLFCVGAGLDEVHGNWRFVAWHRAYLATYERILREVSGEPQLALPYWDWFAEDEFPKAFQSGALIHARRDLNSGKKPEITRNERGPRENSNYATTQPFGKPNLDPQNRSMSFFGWKGPQNEFGLPEVIAHGGIHNWVGGLRGLGDMADLNTSSKDPCFYSHHGNIDRIWEVWKADVFAGSDAWKLNIPSEWKNIRFAFSFSNQREYFYRINDLLETESVKDIGGVALGYRYDNIVPRHPIRRSPAIIAMQRGVSRIAASDKLSDKGFAGFLPSTPVVVSIGSLKIGKQPSSTELVPIADVDRIGAAKILNNSKNLMNQKFAPSDIPLDAKNLPTGQIVVRFGQIELPPANLQLNFYLNNPNASLANSARADGYVGSLNFIPSSDKKSIVEGFELNITDDFPAGISNLKDVQITVVPSVPEGLETQVNIKDIVIEIR